MSIMLTVTVVTYRVEGRWPSAVAAAVAAVGGLVGLDRDGS
jgi:hypothetical protein